MILWILASTIVLATASMDADGVEEGPFKVYRVVPTTNDQLLRLIELFENSEEADFWHAPSIVNNTVDVMVSPEYTERFSDFLELHGYPYNVAIEDLKKLLIEKESSIEIHSRTLSRQLLEERLHDDNSVFMSKLKMGEYYSHNVISTWLERIAERMPSEAEVVTIGKTVEGRAITGIKFGREAPGKKVVILDAGIHAREWSAVHTAIYFINLIVNNREDDTQIRDYLDNMIIYVFPVLNPDGYEFTRTDKTNPRARMWRKSRSSAQCAFDGISNACCQGVDLNRNFAFRFAEIGASRYPCSEIYHGPSAFSEPETRALRDFMLSQKSRLAAYITLHAYSQLWIYSYSHRKFTYAPDIDDTRRVANKAVAELGKMFGTKYQVGTGPEIIYAFSGGSTDWAKETLKVKYSYTIELRPTYDDWNGFVLEKSQLIPTAKETWAGVKVVLDEVLAEWKAAQRKEVELNKIRTERCVDRLAGCKMWIATTPDLCRSAPQSMVRDCAKSCALCHMIAV